MERVERDADVVADLPRELERLLAAVEEAGLESIQRLDADLHLALPRDVRALFDAFDGSLPAFFRRAMRDDAPDLARHEAQHLAAERFHHFQAVLHILD